MPVTIAGIGTAVPPHRIAQSDAAELARPFACRDGRPGTTLPGDLSTFGCRDAAWRGPQRVGRRPGSPTILLHCCKPYDRGPDEAVRGVCGRIGDRRGHSILGRCRNPAGRDYPPCNGLMQWVPGTRVRYRPGQAARAFSGGRPHPCGLHGLPRPDQRPAGVAGAYLQADPSACVLLCAVELCSLHHQYGWNSEQIIANALFADGAGAVDRPLGLGRHASGAYQLVATGSTLIAESEDAMSWRIGDHGFTMTLSHERSRSDRPHMYARGSRRGWRGRVWASHRVGSWAIHPGGPRILAAFGEAAGLDRTALGPSYRVLAEYGNMSSPTIAFILDAATSGRRATALRGPGVRAGPHRRGRAILVDPIGSRTSPALQSDSAGSRNSRTTA